MKLSKTSAHAALAMAYLASQNGDAVIQARQIAEHLGVPTDSALKVLQTLSRHRLVQSQLGRTGGYRMDRAAQDVTLLQIVEAIDGPVDAMVPLTAAGDEAGMGVLRSLCEQVAQRVRSELAGTTVADLVRAQGEGRPQTPFDAEALATAAAN